MMPTAMTGLVVVADRVLVDPEVVAPRGPVELELLAGGIGRPEGDDVRLAAHALAALWPLQDGIHGVDLRGAGDLVARCATRRADVRGLEVRPDHRSGLGFGHRRARRRREPPPLRAFSMLADASQDRGGEQLRDGRHQMGAGARRGPPVPAVERREVARVPGLAEAGGAQVPVRADLAASRRAGRARGRTTDGRPQNQ